MNIQRNINKLNLENICKVILLLYIVVLYAFYEIRLVVEFIYLVMFSLYFIAKRKRLTSYAIWSLFFVGICLLSNLWTLDSIASFKGTRATLEIAFISNLLIGFLDNKRKIYCLLRIFVIAGVILLIKLIIVTPIGAWGSERIGNYIYNANTIGIYLAISSLSAIQLIKLKKNYVYNICIILFFTIIVLTGSRKAFFLFVAGLGLLYLFNVKKKSKIVIVVPIMFIISFMLFQIVMNVPQFYEILGSRIDSLLSILTGEGNIDASARVRMELIDVGIRLIKQKPFLGYGVASYTNISVKGIYSHNNYIELLVGVGLIGTVIYYSIYFNIILKLLKARKKIVVNLFLTLILLFIFLEFGLVSYFNEIYQLIIAASIPIIKLMSND